jgi:hypothetical protein
MEWHEIVDRMPSDACFSHALVLNDLMRVRDAIPDRLPNVEIDKAQYYLGCLNDYVKAARHGARRDEDLAALLEALQREPSEIKDSVRATRLFVTAAAPDGIKEKVKKINSVAGDTAGPLPAFDSVFHAMAWDEANPREPVASSFVDLTYSLDKMAKARVRNVHVETARDKARSRGTGQATAQGPPATRLGTRLRGLLNLGRTLR